MILTSNATTPEEALADVLKYINAMSAHAARMRDSALTEPEQTVCAAFRMVLDSMADDLKAMTFTKLEKE